jgi:Cu(I)/Ag(I) efflux system membrane fusion protein
MRTILLAVLVVVAFTVGYFFRGGGPEPQKHEHAAEEGVVKKEVWTCSMHPQIQLPKPGQCPICGMDLIPVSSDGSGDEGGPPELTMSEKAVKLAEIAVAPVERRAVKAEISMAGKVDYDETHLGYITSWVPGRIDRLYVDYTGVSVKKGDPMVSLYSPELLTAQQELIQSIKTIKKLERSGVASIRETAGQTVDAVREKLRLWGLTKRQIADIEKRGKTTDHTTMYSPISGVVIHKDGLEGLYVKTGDKIYTIADLSQVWVKLDAYESDLSWIRNGQEVELEAEAYPGEVFKGKIGFIDPFLDAKTRTVKVRVNVPNSEGKLKPEMFVRAMVYSVVADAGEIESPLVIPASAPLITGKRAVVYIQVPGKKGKYQGREIVLGPRTGDYYLVREGLSEGELVVVNGNFKIDSALQILAKPSMMYPEESTHTAKGQEKPPQKVDEKNLEPFNVSDAFKTQLKSVFSAYFTIHQALSQDDFKGAGEGVKKLAEAIDTVDMKLLEGKPHMAWMEEQKTLKKSVQELTEAKDIEDARKAFIPISDSLYTVAKRFGTSGSQPVLRFHCPMAAGGKGAYWLQNKPGTENPYYGSAMFKCGEQVETISPGFAKEQS